MAEITWYVIAEEFVTGEKMKSNKPVAVDFVTNKELNQTARVGPVTSCVDSSNPINWLKCEKPAYSTLAH